MAAVAVVAAEAVAAAVVATDITAHLALLRQHGGKTGPEVH